MKLLDGKIVSENIYKNLEKKLFTLKSHQKEIAPCLSVIIVGNRPDSKTYVKMKEKKCADLGIKSNVLNFSENITTNELILELEKLNNDIRVHGILVQLPLPDHIEKKRVLDSVDKNKDVDGFNVFNMGALALNREPNFYPCTPLGCIEILKFYNIDVEGKHIVVIGKSQIVGLPLSLMLMNLGATVSICDDKTINIKEITKSADILFVACGCPNLVKSDWIKQDVIIFLTIKISHGMRTSMNYYKITLQSKN